MAKFCVRLSLIFPVPRFSLSNPFDGGLQPLCARRLAFGFGEPLDIFPLATGAEISERRQRLFVLLERSLKIIRHNEFGPGFRIGTRRLYACLIERNGLLEVAGQDFVAGQICIGSEAAKSIPRIVLRGNVFEEQFALPKNQRAMMLESRRADQNTLVLVKRRAPFDRLGHVRASGVHEPADAVENRLGKVYCLGDVFINARVWLGHGRRIKRQRKFSIRFSTGEGHSPAGAELETLFDFGCYNFGASDRAENESQRDSNPSAQGWRSAPPGS